MVRRSFEPRQFLEDLLEHRVNSVFAVPVMFDALSQVPDLFAANLSHLRSVVVAGAPVPPSLIRRFADRGILLQQAWGMTETSSFATHLPVEWTLDKIGSAGIAMPYTEVHVVDETTNEPVSTGSPGEIVVRGPNVTPGYWRDPDATAAFDDAGWFHSGDIGYLDEDGCLFIIDRRRGTTRSRAPCAADQGSHRVLERRSGRGRAGGQRPDVGHAPHRVARWQTVTRPAARETSDRRAPTAIDRVPIWRIGITGGLVGILCCVGPTVLALFGIVSAATAFAWANNLYDNDAWWFRLGGLAALVALMWIALRRRNQCSIAGMRRLRWPLLGVFAIAVGTYIALYALTTWLGTFA